MLPFFYILKTRNDCIASRVFYPINNRQGHLTKNIYYLAAIPVEKHTARLGLGTPNQ
jgi:hypothetical protein